jgi:hypothetical protein
VNEDDDISDMSDDEDDEELAQALLKYAKDKGVIQENVAPAGKEENVQENIGTVSKDTKKGQEKVGAAGKERKTMQLKDTGAATKNKKKGQQKEVGAATKDMEGSQEEAGAAGKEKPATKEEVGTAAKEEKGMQLNEKDDTGRLEGEGEAGEDPKEKEKKQLDYVFYSIRTLGSKQISQCIWDNITEVFAPLDTNNRFRTNVPEYLG